MIYPKKIHTLIAFMMCMGLLYTGCRTTEEIVEEPEPEPEPIVEEVAPAPVPEPEPEPEPVVIPELGNVYFDFDRSNIRSDAARILDAHIAKLLDLPVNYRVSIDAYTDHIGGDQYNLRLSYRRAASVVQYLTDNGITEDRIDSRGLGKAPIPCYDQYPDDPGCPDNRRAEFEIIEHRYAPRSN